MAKNPKIEILNILNKKMSAYTATQWLKKPLPQLNDKIPSEILKKDNVSDYNKLLKIVKDI
jgi:uncharacterized protein (DUF2384 family)